MKLLKGKRLKPDSRAGDHPGFWPGALAVYAGQHQFGAVEKGLEECSSSRGVIALYHAWTGPRNAAHAFRR